MKNKIELIISTLIIILIATSIFTFSYATEEVELILPEKSETYKKWESLSDEEKENSIQPQYSSIPFKKSIKRSKYNSLFAKVGGSTDSRFQISKDKMTARDQQKTELCWAFSFSSMLQGSGKGKLYSPTYLDYMVSNLTKKQQGSGANYYLAMGANAAGKSPILEEKMRFDDVYNEEENDNSTHYLTPSDKLSSEVLNQKVDARITDSIEFASIFKDIDSENNITYYNGQKSGNTISDENKYSDNDIKAMRDKIKEHIKNYGPVNSNMYSELIFDISTGKYIDTDFFNSETGASYCNDTSKAINHAITIVGWDDEYAIDNFIESNRPKNKGAYIVLNSYGTNLGDNGYIYVSYDDVFIEQTIMGIKTIEEYESEEDLTYDNIYQYDELGMNIPVSFNSKNMMIANVFSRDSSKIEYINEIGIFLPITEGVEVYVNSSDDDKSNLRQVAVDTNDIEPGYHVIKLSSPVKLTGNKFVVAAKLTNSEDFAYIPLEANIKDSNITFFNTNNFYDNVTANTGESFISADNGEHWQDINGTRVNLGALKNTNVCLKAYTVKSVPEVLVTGITLNKTTLSIEEGDTATLEATITPANATNQNVEWSSSDTSVATISKTGVITALKQGTTTITVTTEDGNKTATCIVTVNPKTTTEDDIYKDKSEDNGSESKEGDVKTEATNAKKEDATVAKTSLPYTGVATYLIIIIVALIAIVIFIRYRSLKDVK